MCYTTLNSRAEKLTRFRYRPISQEIETEDVERVLNNPPDGPVKEGWYLRVSSVICDIHRYLTQASQAPSK